MALPAFPIEGGCRCGTVRFRLTRAPLSEAVCHCRACQQMSASAFSTTLMMPADGFEIITGETATTAVMDGAITHHHCAGCKAWLFTTPPAALGFINVRATLLDDAGWFTPWLETQTAEKLPWAQTGAVRSYERFPEPGEYPALVAGYRAARGIAG